VIERERKRQERYQRPYLVVEAGGGFIRPYIGRQVSRHRTNPRQNQLTKLSKQAKQADQVSSTPSTPCRTGPDGRADNQTTKQKATRRHEQDRNQTNRETNENQSESKQHPRCNQIQTSQQPSSRTFQTPTLTKTSRKTAQRTAIPTRGIGDTGPGYRWRGAANWAVRGSPGGRGE
jgi:hypothetical protein